MTEVTIEIREKTISVQAGNIDTNTDEAKKILQAALDALATKPKETYKHELVYEK